jgi:hypothetical protein
MSLGASVNASAAWRRRPRQSVTQAIFSLSARVVRERRSAITRAVVSVQTTSVPPTAPVSSKTGE